MSTCGARKKTKEIKQAYEGFLTRMSFWRCLNDWSFQPLVDFTQKSIMVNNLRIPLCGYSKNRRKSCSLFLILVMCCFWLFDLDFLPWCFSVSGVLPSLSESARVITAAQTWLEPSSFQSQAHTSLSYFLFLSSSSSSPQPPSSEFMLQPVFMNKNPNSLFISQVF